MKKLILALTILLLTLGSKVEGQCPTAVNLQNSITNNGTNDVYFYWENNGATTQLFEPLNFVPHDIHGVVDPNMLYMGFCASMGIIFDTTGMCNRTISWRIKNYCFTPTGDYLNDSLNATKSYSNIQNYFVDCPIPPPSIIIIHNGHINIPKKRH